MRSANQAIYTLPPVDEVLNEISMPYTVESKVFEIKIKLYAHKATVLNDIPAKMTKLAASDIGMHIT